MKACVDRIWIYLVLYIKMDTVCGPYSLSYVCYSVDLSQLVGRINHLSQRVRSDIHKLQDDPRRADDNFLIFPGKWSIRQRLPQEDKIKTILEKAFKGSTPFCHSDEAWLFWQPSFLWPFARHCVHESALQNHSVLQSSYS